MSLIPAPLKLRYAGLSQSASACIHRHAQPGMAQELLSLSQAVSDTDARDTYGRGGSLQAFEQQLCDLFGNESCLFLPTGTLAQCAALKCYQQHTGRSDVGLHPTSHLLLHEHMAVEQLWGLKAREMGQYHRVLSPDDVSQLDPSTTAAIVIELPMREVGGDLPSWEDLLAMRSWCDKHDVRMHLDGARVWQVTEYYQLTLAQITALFDSLYVSFYKDLGGIFGAALLGNKLLIDESRIWARRAGGNPVTLYPEVLAAREGLAKYLPKMPVFVDYTRALCEALRNIDVCILPAQPRAAMFHLKFDMDAEQLTGKIVDYAEATGIVVLPLPRAGDEDHCICEIAVGDQACTKPAQFWAEHMQACLAG